MDEKNLDDFFRNDSKEKEHKNLKIKRKPAVSVNDKRNGYFRQFFRNRFSFDMNVNLTDSVSVLNRRNYVISNIIFLVNIVFTVFAFIGISKSNWIITLVFFLLMFAISQTIKQMMQRKKEDHSHQVVIMYLQSIYVFILAVLLYIKVYLGFRAGHETKEPLLLSEFSITQAAYILIYLSLVIASLYQNPKLTKTMMIWGLVVFTVLHCTILHPELFYNASSIGELFNYVFVTNKEIAIDIGLRTVVFLVFNAAIYSSAAISHYMNEERKNEFTKRVGVEANYADMVESIFEAVKVYNLNLNNIEQKISAKRVKECSKELSNAMAFSSDIVEGIMDFSVIHVKRINELVLNDKKEIRAEDIGEIVEKTKLASKIIKRLQLYKKSEDIVSAVFSNSISEDFKYNMSQIQNDKISQVVLISEIYDILRSDRYYKKGLNHLRSLELLKSEFSIFFDKDIIDRFIKYNREIELAYEKAI